MTIASLYHQTLKTTRIDEATLKALLSHIHHFSSNGDLFLHWNEEARDLDKFNLYLPRILLGEPLPYIVGLAYFAGLTFFVDESVLIPRPETEELVDHVSDYIQTRKTKNLLDLGTGSGCIAISLKHRFPYLDVWASDISQCALEVAHKNALSYGMNLQFFSGDWYEPFKNQTIKFDVIVSNPPYIAHPETVAKNVLDYEPHGALFSNGGISNHLIILQGAPNFLSPRGLLMLEIDEDQMAMLSPIVHSLYEGAKIDFIKDLQGKYRFLRIELTA
jgi:release factor glutamine methyltransferase